MGGVASIETQLSEGVVEVLRAGDADLGFVWGYPEPEGDDLHT